MAAGQIAANQARANFTSMCIDVYTDMMVPKSFLRSFFPTVQEFTKFLSIQVERDYELMAVDVLRGSEGNRNTFDKSTEKVMLPPYYYELFDATEIDLYDRMFGSTSIDMGIYTQLVAAVARKLTMLKNKIERRYELQCSQVLQTGVVTLESGTNIDFQRKAASLVAYSAGNDFSINTVNPYSVIEAGAKFIREIGKSPDSTVNVIMGESAWNAFLTNSIVINRNKLMAWPLDQLSAATRGATGYSYHGQVDTGSYRANLFTYPESYDIVASNGTRTTGKYIDDKKVIVIPQTPRFKLGFAAVPQLLRSGTGMMEDMELAPLAASPYVVGDYIDPRKTTHDFTIKSAGVAIPTAVDQIYTVTVLS
jgi:hypothetical protein